MAKFNFKKFALEKGEKVVLIGAGVGLAILAVMGVTGALSADSPQKIKDDLKASTANVTNSVNSETAANAVKPLEPWVTTKISFQPVGTKEFETPFLAFETVDNPSKLRDNPAVLGIFQSQVDIVRAPIKAYDIRVIDGKTEIGLLRVLQTGTADLSNLRGTVGNRNRGARAQPNAPVAPAPVPPPAPPPAGGGRGGREMTPPAAGFDASAVRGEKTVIYVPVDEIDTETNKKFPPAFTVYPVRMIVVQAAFPLKKQLEVIQKALKLKTIAEANEASRTAPADGPTFDGFEVEKKVIQSNGQEFDWAFYDHTAEFLKTIYPRKVADQPDDGFLSYFLRPDQKMSVPLPALADNLGQYPATTMSSIRAGYEKLRTANKPPLTPSAARLRFAGDAAGANPFLPITGTGTGTGLSGFGSGGDAGPGVAAPPTRGGEGPPRFNATTTPAPNPNAPAGQQVMPELEYMLIRFLDVDVKPGYSYQYRLRVKMKNPNFGKSAREVSRADDAKQEILFGPWVTIETVVTLPSDSNMYAGDPVDYAKKLREQYKDKAVIDLLDNRNGELPVVQMQSWMEQVKVDKGKGEPVGTWVVAEVPVGKGEFIGRKQFIRLPIWSSEKVAYLLQELPKYSVAKAKEKPKGMYVDFTTTQLLADYEGGKTRTRIGEKTIEDEADVELLIVRADGSTFVRNSGLDRKNEDRQQREEQWNAWISRVERATTAAGQLTDPTATPASPFGRQGAPGGTPGGG